jgi:hypothetical protein
MFCPNHSLSYVFWRHGRVIKMVAPNIKYELQTYRKKFIEFAFINVNNLNFRAERNHIFYVQYSCCCTFLQLPTWAVAPLAPLAMLLAQSDVLTQPFCGKSVKILYRSGFDSVHSRNQLGSTDNQTYYRHLFALCIHMWTHTYTS